jgi:hypothetical protein
MLRWLREHGCPWYTVQVADTAACKNKVAVLEYLQQEGAVFIAEQLIDLLNTAAVRGSLAAAKWLRQQGADWPAVLHNFSGCVQWSGEVLAWARAEGCTSPLY